MAWEGHLCAFSASSELWVVVFSVNDAEVPSTPDTFDFPVVSRGRFSSDAMYARRRPSYTGNVAIKLFVPKDARAVSSDFSFKTFVDACFLSSTIFATSVQGGDSLGVSYFSSLEFLLPVDETSSFVAASASFEQLLADMRPRLAVSGVTSTEPVPNTASASPMVAYVSTFAPFSFGGPREVPKWSITVFFP